jgi:hypothetical protein
MMIGELVNQIVQDIDDDGFISRPTIDTTKNGIVVSLKEAKEWIPGAGSIDIHYALISWDDGSLRWVNTVNLTVPMHS